MSSKYHLNIAEYPVTSLVKIVADLLDSIIAANDPLIDTSSPDEVTHFHSRAVPNITVYDYLNRILKFAPYSNEVLISLLVYFDRIIKLKRLKYAVNSLTVHRLIITSIVVASKFTSDVFYPNSRYAKVGGISLGELNQLELEFLFLSNFNLHVKLEDMQAYGDQLLTHALTQQATLVEHLKITPPVKLATPTLDSKSTLIKKRKRDEITSTTQQKRRPEQLLDQAPHPKNMNGHIHSKIYTCQPHLERIMHYTQDC